MPLSSSTNVADFQLAINQILYIYYVMYGVDFPFYQLTRVSGMTEDDAKTLRDLFATYYKSRQNRPSNENPGHADVPDSKVIEEHGRSGNHTNVGVDTAKNNDETFQAGRSNHGGNPNADSGPLPYEASTGR